jgi:PD-(D/E)XK nuclease superfamily
MIHFDEASHRYSNNGQTYISATQLIDMVTNKFDVKGQASRMAIAHGMTPEYWEEKWKKISKKAQDTGNELHARQEDLLGARGLDLMEGKTYRVQNPALIAAVSGNMDYFYWPDGVYSELLLWNHEYQIAGRADKVILSTHKSGYRFAHVHDYKTNKKLSTSSWFTPGEGYRRLKYPLAHLMDCDMVKYSLQMSIYQFMLEQMGFRPGMRVLLHYPPLPLDLGYEGERRKKPLKYKLDYLREDTYRLLNYYADEQGIKRPPDM